jgi:hypothetical protein
MVVLRMMASNHDGDVVFGFRFFADASRIMVVRLVPTRTARRSVLDHR